MMLYIGRCEATTRERCCLVESASERAMTDSKSKYINTTALLSIHPFSSLLPISVFTQCYYLHLFTPHSLTYTSSIRHVRSLSHMPCSAPNSTQPAHPQPTTTVCRPMLMMTILTSRNRYSLYTNSHNVPIGVQPILLLCKIHFLKRLVVDAFLCKKTHLTNNHLKK
jgi:hypothetical protein